MVEFSEGERGLAHANQVLLGSLIAKLLQHGVFTSAQVQDLFDTALTSLERGEADAAQQTSRIYIETMQRLFASVERRE